MTYKTLLVHVEDTPEAEARLSVAVDLAARWSAHLIGVGGCLPALANQPFVAAIDAASLQLVADLERSDLAGAEARFHRLTAPLAMNSMWRSGAAYPDQVAAGFAAGADLIVAGCVCESSPSTLDPGALTLRAGIPVLAIPAAVTALPMHDVVIAWTNTREARRAVTDAMPLLQAATRVHLVEVVGPSDEEDPWGGRAGVVDRLAAHGVAASAERVRRTNADDADEVIACAEQREADLIVAGAYGHSRLREWSFGGMTRDLLERSPHPVLFSH